MMDREGKAARAAYMRTWREKNKDHVNAQVAQRGARIKLSDPQEYDRRLELAQVRNDRYRKANHDKVRMLSKANAAKHRTPEKSKAKREKYKFDYSTKVSLKSARNRATEKNLPFDLTDEWYEAEFSKGCAVTGLPLQKNGSKTPLTAHVDRIVPSLGYVMSNCRLVCASYNLAKKNWSDSDVEMMARALIAKLDA